MSCVLMNGTHKKSMTHLTRKQHRSDVLQRTISGIEAVWGDGGSHLSCWPLLVRSESRPLPNLGERGRVTLLRAVCLVRAIARGHP